jgi:hypothetical protein
MRYIADDETEKPSSTMRFPRRRGVSAAVAILFLIAISVSAAAIVHVFIGGLAGNLTLNGGSLSRKTDDSILHVRNRVGLVRVLTPPHRCPVGRRW